MAVIPSKAVSLFRLSKDDHLSRRRRPAHGPEQHQQPAEQTIAGARSHATAAEDDGTDDVTVQPADDDQEDSPAAWLKQEPAAGLVEPEEESFIEIYEDGQAPSKADPHLREEDLAIPRWPPEDDETDPPEPVPETAAAFDEPVETSAHADDGVAAAAPAAAAEAVPADPAAEAAADEPFFEVYETVAEPDPRTVQDPGPRPMDEDSEPDPAFLAERRSQARWRQDPDDGDRPLLDVHPPGDVAEPRFRRPGPDQAPLTAGSGDLTFPGRLAVARPPRTPPPAGRTPLEIDEDDAAPAEPAFRPPPPAEPALAPAPAAGRMAAIPPELLPVMLIAEVPRLRRFAAALLGDERLADRLVQMVVELALADPSALARDQDLAIGLLALLHQSRQAPRQPADGGPIQGQRAFERSLLSRLPGADRAELGEFARAMATLSEDDRELLLLVALENLTYRQVAAVIKVPAGRVMARVARARDRLAQALEADPAADGALR